MHTPNEGPRTRLDGASLLIVGLLLFACYLTTRSAWFHSIDEIAIYVAAKDLALRGGLRADALYWVSHALDVGAVAIRGADGHYYTSKDLLPILASTPFVWLAHLAGVSQARTALLATPLVGAAAGALMIPTARRAGFGVRTSLVAGLTLGLATLAWVYAETLYQHSFAMLALLVALWAGLTARTSGQAGWAVLSGLALGLAGASAVPLWLAAPVYGLYLLCPPQPGRKLARLRLPIAFVLGAIPLGLLQAGYNTLRFGSPLETGYQKVGTLVLRPDLIDIGLYGLLFSPPRGLLFHVPLVVLVPIGLAIGWREHRREMTLSVGVIAVMVLFYATFYSWWGGLAWGPRHLTPIMPHLVLLMLPVFERARGVRRWLVGALWALSAAIQAAAGLFNYLPGVLDMMLEWQPYEKQRVPIWSVPVLWRPDVIARLIAPLRRGERVWDVLWIDPDGRLDGVLLGACLVAIATGAALLALAWRGRRVGWHAAGGYAAVILTLTGLTLARYPRPDGYRPDLADAATTLESGLAPGDGVLAVLPTTWQTWLDTYRAPNPMAGLPLEAAPVSQGTADLLGLWTLEHPRVWVISEGTVAGDPANGAEAWLARHGYAAGETWIGGYRLATYHFLPFEPPLEPLNVTFGDDEIRLTGFSTVIDESADAIRVDVQLEWEALRRPAGDYTAFVHLQAADGSLIGQHDSPPQAGYAPTSTWSPSQAITDRHGIWISPAPPPGRYALYVGLYNSLTGERLPTSPATPDSRVPLSAIEIAPD